ncbi:MAG: 5-formyltetrahydrofolate cyclo-ligase [Propionibacteriales bacterium]|nr:5-formyltetrahydrofolate cyclo-ligase [Propionibacteriales bacterium]
MPGTDPVATQGDGTPTAHRVRAILRAKQILREAVAESRSLSSSASREAADTSRTERAQTFVGELARPGLTVSAYLSTDDEPGTLELVTWLHSLGVTVLLPVVGSDEVTLPVDDSGRAAPHWAAYSGPETLQTGTYGILQPEGEVLPPEAINEAHMIICPGLAASTDGSRLGRGGAWYDRAFGFASDTAARVCLLNDNEVISSVPTESSDRGIDVIITEARTIVCGLPDSGTASEELA